MPTLRDPKEAIRAFARRFDYDMSYQEALLEHAPEAFGVFAAAQGMSAVRSKLPVEPHWVARLGAMQAERCGGCLRLVARMAREAGVDEALVETVLERPQDLPEPLRAVHEHAARVSRDEVDAASVERVRAAWGEEGLCELAVVLAGCRLFTTVKRTLGVTWWSA